MTERALAPKLAPAKHQFCPRELLLSRKSRNAGFGRCPHACAQTRLAIRKMHSVLTRICWPSSPLRDQPTRAGFSDLAPVELATSDESGQTLAQRIFARIIQGDQPSAGEKRTMDWAKRAYDLFAIGVKTALLSAAIMFVVVILLALAYGLLPL